MFESGFPECLKNELEIVLKHIDMKNNGTSSDYTEGPCKLLDGSKIQYPYRIYFNDDEGKYQELNTKEQKLIYHCIFSRSYNGYVREKHLRAILEEDYPEWCMPYIWRLSAEYIVEIIEMIYKELKQRDNTLFQTFCQSNPYLFRYYHSRMISYWNEFYRSYCYKYHDYVGYKLYKECFGYKRSNDFIK